MKNLLKWLLCFMLVPVITVGGLGVVLLIIYLLFRYPYIVIPLPIIGFWVYVAKGLYEDIF